MWHQMFLPVWLCVIIAEFQTVLAQEPNAADELNTRMLKEHNAIRQKALDCKIAGQPQAAKMPMLTYDQELADAARKWALECRAERSSSADRVTKKWGLNGQNVASSTDFQGVVDLWFIGHRHYDYANNQCDRLYNCNSYLQIVSAKTVSIGCAYNRCNRTADFPYDLAVVCNYGPQANFSTQPYEKGEKTMCSGTTHSVFQWINRTQLLAIILWWLNNFFSLM
ncbi:hypothetical protein D915_004622 [Fasciola hepatica]|uniref:SCP domain-containing protein n=1 Tax=Fasciola hepatica TaxID=6192 RepID=A0A4E0S197_FASHE|nr:hypothetical protein D915_004622 [Fasciola hepatica]